MTLGTLIKKYRGYRDLTQVTLAERVGTTQAHISRLESGHLTGGPWTTLGLLARVLGIPPEELGEAVLATAPDAGPRLTLGIPQPRPAPSPGYALTPRPPYQPGTRSRA